MTARTVETARRLRRERPYMRAADAIALARWRETAPTMDDGETWDVGGFTLRVSVTYDEVSAYDDDERPTFVKRASAETVPARGYFPADDDYAETPLYPRSSRVAGYRARGASRAVAAEMADADMHAEISAYFRGDMTPYVITVTASREGIELGRASLGGVTFGDNYGDSLRYVAETARELESEALADATETLGRLCGSAADRG